MLREEILTTIEKNSRVDVHELAVRLGSTDEMIAAEMARMEEEGVICGYHTMINWEKTTLDKVKKSVDAFVREAEQFDDITMLCVKMRQKGQSV